MHKVETNIGSIKQLGYHKSLILNLGEDKGYLFKRGCQGNKIVCGDWLKMFLSLNRNTSLAQAVDIMMAQAKRIYILIIKVSRLFSFPCCSVF